MYTVLTRKKQRHNNNNNNNNNTRYNVYGADIMTQIISRVHPVHLMNVEQRQAAADPQTKPTDLGSGSACGCSSTSVITIYYYSARNPILILHDQ